MGVKETVSSLTEKLEEQRSILPFSIMYTGQTFSLLGSRLVQFSIIWWLTSTTGSASVLALGSIIALLPQVLVTPFAGALVDRWNRRAVMIVTDLLIAGAVVVLALLYAWDAVSVWHIYGLMLIRSVCGTFHWIAWKSSTKMLVPEKHLSRIAGIEQAIQGMASFVAPPMGAFLIEMLPIYVILAIDVVTAVLAVVPLVFISIPQPSFLERNGKTSVIASMREGLGYVRTKTGLLLIVGMAMAINFILTPAFSLEPLLVTKYFNGGAVELGWLQSAYGVGLILGGLTLGVWGGFKRRTVTSLSALALSGVFIASVGLVPPTGFNLVVGLNLLAGFLNPIVNGPLIAVLQAKVPNDYQGRVFALIQSGSQFMAPLGLAIGGPVADAMGIQFLFLVGGATMSIMGVAAFFVKPMLYVEDASFAVERVESLASPKTGIIVSGMVKD
ncbi:MAG TPA: MFS transporter [Patescibacteria group bacterium]|nr:MFS transporter [Patescibacteria group bacterium]